MAWTAPKTWTVGEVLTAANLNLHLRDNLNALAPDGAGALPGWNPVVTQSVTPGQTENYAEYMRLGRLIVALFKITFTGAGTATNVITLTGLPATAADVSAIGGAFRYFDAGNTNRAGSIVGATTTTAKFIYDGFGADMGNGDFAIANTDLIQGVLVMVAAS